MRFALFTAKRYLFGRKRLGATGWISLISALAIGIVTAALVCVLAVYNGYVVMLLSGEENTSPELMIKPSKGLTTETDKLIDKLKKRSEIKDISQVITTQGLLHAAGVDLVCEVYGIDSLYTRVVGIDSKLTEGAFLPTYYTEQDTLPTAATIGIALAAEGTTKESDTPAHLTFPKREGIINPLATASAFVEQAITITGILPAYSEDVNRRIYINISALRETLNYQPNVVSHLALKIDTESNIARVQSQLQEALGADYLVLNREEQQPELTLLIKAEKLMVYTIMLFILILAAFNLASSLVILTMEKAGDLLTLRAMGARGLQLASIFGFTGLMVSLIGSSIGLVLGLSFCLLQKHFGFITSGEGPSLMPFPIDIQGLDIMYIMLATVIVSILSASIPITLAGRQNTTKTK